jgi:hypothetical protein
VCDRLAAEPRGVGRHNGDYLGGNQVNLSEKLPCQLCVHLLGGLLSDTQACIYTHIYTYACVVALVISLLV